MSTATAKKRKAKLEPATRGPATQDAVLALEPHRPPQPDEVVAHFKRGVRDAAAQVGLNEVVDMNAAWEQIASYVPEPPEGRALTPAEQRERRKMEIQQAQAACDFLTDLTRLTKRFQLIQAKVVNWCLGMQPWGSLEISEEDFWVQVGMDERVVKAAAASYGKMSEALQALPLAEAGRLADLYERATSEDQAFMGQAADELRRVGQRSVTEDGGAVPLTEVYANLPLYCDQIVNAHTAREKREIVAQAGGREMARPFPLPLVPFVVGSGPTAKVMFRGLEYVLGRDQLAAFVGRRLYFRFHVNGKTVTDQEALDYLERLEVGDVPADSMTVEAALGDQYIGEEPPDEAIAWLDGYNK